MQGILIGKGKEELERAHDYYNRKEYLLAIQYFKNALLYLDSIPAELQLLHFDSKYFKALEFVSKIWGWLGIIYRETGYNEEATECFKKETYYAHLNQIYHQKYAEFKYSKRIQRKILLNDIGLMIIIELILLFTGYNISFILNDARIYVNFTFFLIDFIVFLAYLIKIRRSYELRREFRNEPLIFCPGLKKQLSKYSTKRQRLIDSLFRNIFSFTFVVLTVSIYLFIIFSQAISAGNSPINGIINGTGFHAGYISLIILAILLEFLLLHWNKAMKRKEKEIVP